MRCERSTCPDPHDAREHLDPRHEKYDGPDIQIQALPSGPRRAARDLISAGASVPEVVELVREIHRLRDQVAAVTVDADRKVREASARALDCADHGRIIRELESQLHQADERAERNDRARVKYMMALTEIAKVVGYNGPGRDAVRKIGAYARKALGR